MNHKLILTPKQSIPAGNTDIKIISFPEMQSTFYQRKKNCIEGSNEGSNTAALQFRYKCFFLYISNMPLE